MATDEVMKNYFARFIGHEMMFMVFSSDFHGIFTNLSFIVSPLTETPVGKKRDLGNRARGKARSRKPDQRGQPVSCEGALIN